VNELALFAGAGGGILGGKLLGWKTVCAVEYDAYAASVLVARQNDGCLEPFPVWDDVRTFDGKAWRGIVDVVSGGFPCTDISAAKQNAQGINGSASGLWSEMARIVGEIRPRHVFVENSPMLVKRGLAVVLSDLAEMGYDAEWGIVGACHAGAPHNRKRVWIVGHSERSGLEGYSWHGYDSQGRPDKNRPDEQTGVSILEKPAIEGLEKCLNLERENRGGAQRECPRSSHFSLWGPWAGAGLERGDDGALRFIQPGVCGVAHGVAARVDRLKAIGNGQCPEAAAIAWRLLGGPRAHNTTQ
jgi:DNA (cytosine-5)-methyltransferase 1